MYELSENPAENSKRQLRALPGITDMWEGFGNHPAASRLPSPHGPTPHLPCRKKLWAADACLCMSSFPACTSPAAYSPFAPSQGAMLHTSLQGSVPRKEAPAYAITQAPWVGLSQRERKKSEGKRRGGGHTTLGAVMSIHDYHSCQTVTLPRLRLFPC